MARIPKAIDHLEKWQLIHPKVAKCQAQGFQLIKLREIYSKQQEKHTAITIGRREAPPKN